MNGNTLSIVLRLIADPVNTKPASTEFSNFTGIWNDPFIKDDDDPKRVHFYDVKCFNKTAEIAGRYLSKGRQVLVEGKLKQERWETEGQKRSKHVIYADSITLLGSANPDQSQGESEQAPSSNSNDGGWEAL